MVNSSYGNLPRPPGVVIPVNNQVKHCKRMGAKHSVFIIIGLG